MDMGALMDLIGFMSIGMMRSIASGAGARAMGMGARMVPGGCIGMALVQISVFGVAQHPMVQAVHIARRAVTRSDIITNASIRIRPCALLSSLGRMLGDNPKV